MHILPNIMKFLQFIQLLFIVFTIPLNYRGLPNINLYMVSFWTYLLKILTRYVSYKYNAIYVIIEVLKKWHTTTEGAITEGAGIEV